MTARPSPPRELLQCVALYDAGRYWHAHEALEDLWRATQDPARRSLYQGIIQLAAAFVHLQRDNLRGGGSLLRKAAANLRRCQPSDELVRSEALLQQIGACIAAVDAGNVPSPPGPILQRAAD